MRRATITIPDDLENELDAFIDRQEATPSLASVVQSALRRFIKGEGAPGNELASLVLRNRREIRATAARHGVTSIRLFGSVARGEGGPESDLDFVVEPRHDVSLFDLARLRVALIELLGVDVDVVAAGSMAPDLREQIHGESLLL